MIEVTPDDGPGVLVANVGDDVEVRRPQLKLPLPVDDGRERSTHQEGTFAVTL